MIVEILNVKSKIKEQPLLNLPSISMYQPTFEKLNARAENYQSDSAVNIYAFYEDSVPIGLIVFKIENNTATILNFSVLQSMQNKGIGSKLMNFIFEHFSVEKIIAETDDDAIGFYKKYGFVAKNVPNEYGVNRYFCVCTNVTHHYNALIDENNDPVYDPEPLRIYMDKWDGQVFIDELQLSETKNVLEIGIGTGRLAIKTAPLCSELTGIDISNKTINRAKTNLIGYKNVNLICDNFLSFKFKEQFDVIYSSLTFMHIKDKQLAIDKVAQLLKTNGAFVLSIDKNTDNYINMARYRLNIYPDNPTEITKYISKSGLVLLKRVEIEFAYIYVSLKIS